MIVLIICYDRVHNLEQWLNCWKKMDTVGCELVFLITSDVPIMFEVPEYLEIVKMSNFGMDIGALQRFISTREDYDRLFWCPDDFLPLRPDLFRYYYSADLVGTYWSTETSNHIRSGGVCVTKEVVKFLRFPSNASFQNACKHSCYLFEHLRYNFYTQVKKAGYTVKMADGSIPPDSPAWRDVVQDYLFDARWYMDNYGKVVGYECPF